MRSVMNAEELPFQEEFDAVFSNAVLHWIERADGMIAGVYRSLRPGGRFVAHVGATAVCTRSVPPSSRGIEPARDGWRGSRALVFPTPGDYATRLERAGFRVDSIALIPRPTPLPDDIGFLETFAQSFLQGLSGPEREKYVQEVSTALEPELRQEDGTWVADYVRLRFAATKAPRLA